ncbi:LysM peptidoglycan-binding domain-containing M23 family metallopeptidase [Streptomyces phaeochromogenes]|uniref:LysM peptidoglycan-binding domain-containing M23 family metallopeptidase n=1 Tax=Streptomyces phaeochromogenes TaxID=1923 RepID=UPI0006E27237|nr:LysM peptidoglycan-binding domain-containing M23 family metallopeptidase [Streptomyces phaeochromogenes]
MPAKGKHRRPKSQRFTRSIAVAGTGGAALALPLLGATGAHAATSQSAADSVASVSNVANKAAESAPAAADKKAEAKKAAAKTYSVRAGDSLSKIADTQDVSGGWKKLYEDNRKAIGGDPALIHPGLKLSIGKAAATSSSDSGASKATQSSAKKAAAPKAAAAPKPAAEASAAGFTLPVAGAGVGTPYKMSGSMWSSGYHTGVDFVVPTGTSLKSVGAGTVVSAGWGGAYGNQVVIQLADGHYAQYAHLSSLSVSAGQAVTEGQQVGLSGATGNVTGPHLHFEIRTTPDYGSDVDPLAYLRGKGVSV